MSDQNTESVEGTESAAAASEPVDDQRIPYERFEKVNAKARSEAKRAADLEKRVADMQAQLEERETAGLPDLERERKAREQLEKKLADAERRAEDTERKATLMQRRSLVESAAARAGFDDPSDATRYPELVDLDAIEDADQADRAVKRLAKAKPRLLKDDGPSQPQIGRVLENGKTANPNQPQTGNVGSAMGLVSSEEEAAAVSGALQHFLKTRGKTSITFDT